MSAFECCIRPRSLSFMYDVFPSQVNDVGSFGLKNFFFFANIYFRKGVTVLWKKQFVNIKSLSFLLGISFVCIEAYVSVFIRCYILKPERFPFFDFGYSGVRLKALDTIGKYSI